jgi:hypothetical protein
MSCSNEKRVPRRILIACLLLLSGAALVIAAPSYFTPRSQPVSEMACLADGYC